MVLSTLCVQYRGGRSTQCNPNSYCKPNKNGSFDLLGGFKPAMPRDSDPQEIHQAVQWWWWWDNQQLSNMRSVNSPWKRDMTSTPTQQWSTSCDLAQWPSFSRSLAVWWSIWYILVLRCVENVQWMLFAKEGLFLGSCWVNAVSTKLYSGDERWQQ